MSKNFDQINDRLSRIATQWTLVLQAHSDETKGQDPAKEAILQRYGNAVYRYLLGAVGDADVAEELCQEFAIRFLRGDFFRVNPDRGKFRNYIKTVLINLVNQHFNQQKKNPRQLPLNAPEPADLDACTDHDSQLFDECLREDLLSGTWTALHEVNPNYHCALILRVKHNDATSKELAAELSKILEKNVTGDWVRKTVERARVKFAELLVQETRHVLNCETDAELREELELLRLYSYCKHAFGD